MRIFFKNPELDTFEPLLGAKGLHASHEFYEINMTQALVATAFSSDQFYPRIAGYRVMVPGGELTIDASDAPRDERGRPKLDWLGEKVANQSGILDFDLILNVSFAFLRI